MLELPQRGLGTSGVENIADLMEAVHVQLTHE
jgi:hypothetical protein